MASENDGSNSTKIWDIATVALMAVVLVMAFSDATRPYAIGIGVFVPMGLGVIAGLLAIIDGFVKGGKSDAGAATIILDVGMVLLVIAVIGLAISPGTRPLAIAIGIFVPAGGGLIATLVGMVDYILKHGTSKDDKNFSSLAPEEERSFLGHERFMRANEGRANLIGFGSAGALFVVGMVVTLGLYTPCFKFCQHAPSGCKTEAQLSAFKASCQTSCANLEKMAGLQISRAQPGLEKERRLAMEPVSGTEFVQALEACSFANGAGSTCEKVVEKAISMGLWCEEK